MRMSYNHFHLISYFCAIIFSIPIALMNKFLLKTPPYLFTIVVTISIIYLTLFPHPLPDGTPKLFPHADKLVHALMFWAFYTSFAFDRLRKQQKDGAPTKLSSKWLSIIMAATIAFGLAVEIAQSTMDIGRGGDCLDFLSDVVGALVASQTLRYIKRAIFRF